MKVVIVGGYGVFGSRLARLLIRDEHQVWIGGRDGARAQTLADELGAEPLSVDIFKDPMPIFDVSPDVVVDAAGPFQGYGADPYRLARLCVENDADYLDLSDDAAFTAGIEVLDDQAKRAGRRVLSGVSSVPGLSSAAVDALRHGLDTIKLIDIAILPGNRAPRGRSVMSSILEGAGRPLKIWRGRRWRMARGWSMPKHYWLEPGLRRRAYLVNVPDLLVLPGHFDAGSVVFRAGLELAVMNYSLALLARLRRWGLMVPTAWLLSPLHWLAERLEVFGSDRGGMIVEVIGNDWRHPSGPAIKRRWRLVVEGGDGPFIPCTAARAVLRRRDQIAAGARACLAEVPLDEMQAAMSDLKVRFDWSEDVQPTLFEHALGDHWHQLSGPIRDLHGVQDIETFGGRAVVERGSGLMAGVLAWVLGLPRSGGDVAVTVTKIRRDHCEVWRRDFDGQVFQSVLSPASRPYHMIERFGPLSFELALPVEDQQMSLEVSRGWFLGIPLPSWILPASDSREYAEDGRFHFDVALRAPFGGGLIVRYRGFLEPVSEQP